MGCTSSSSTLDIRRTVVQSSSTAIIRSMTDREKIAIKRTWRFLSRNMDSVGAKLFLEIFSIRPALQTMFAFRHVPIDSLPGDSDFRRKNCIYPFIRFVYTSIHVVNLFTVIELTRTYCIMRNCACALSLSLSTIV